MGVKLLLCVPLTVHSTALLQIIARRIIVEWLFAVQNRIDSAAGFFIILMNPFFEPAASRACRKRFFFVRLLLLIVLRFYEILISR